MLKFMGFATAQVKSALCEHCLRRPRNLQSTGFTRLTQGVQLPNIQLVGFRVIITPIKVLGKYMMIGYLEYMMIGYLDP